MKKITFTVIAIIFFMFMPVEGFTEKYDTSEVGGNERKVSNDKALDGYYWRDLSTFEKQVFASAFIFGYSQGYWWGEKSGYISGVKAAEIATDKYTPISGKELATQLLDPNFLKIMVNTKFLSEHFITVDISLIENLEAEVDGFYKTFPLCRRKRLDIMLSELLHVWAQDIIKRQSYKEIGEKCAE